MKWDGTEWKCEKIESIYMSRFSSDQMRARDMDVCILLKSPRVLSHTLHIALPLPLLTLPQNPFLPPR